MIYGLDVKTIIRLLLDFAPKTVLDDLELTESTRDEWADDLKSGQGTLRGDRSIIDMSSLALYYATKKRSNRERLLAYGRVEVDLYTLYDFAQMVKAEDFDEVEKLVKAIPKEKRQKNFAKARESLVRERYDWDEIANMRAKLLNSGKKPKDADSSIRASLKIPQSTYAGWRKRESLKRKTTV